VSACSTGACAAPTARPYKLLVYALAGIVKDAELTGVDAYYVPAIDMSLRAAGKTRAEFAADCLAAERGTA
jgi:hypothetical protein